MILHSIYSVWNLCLMPFIYIPQNVPKGFADKIKHLRLTHVNMRVEGYIHNKAVDVRIKYDEDSMLFTEGWLTFVRANKLHKFNWGVFKLLGRDEVVVHVYNVPNPTNADEGEWVVVEHIMISDSEAEPVALEETLSDSEPVASEETLSDSEAEPVASEETNPVDVGEDEMEVDDEEDEGQNPPWFDCPAQYNTAVSTL